MLIELQFEIQAISTNNIHHQHSNVYITMTLPTTIDRQPVRSLERTVQDITLHPSRGGNAYPTVMRMAFVIQYVEGEIRRQVNRVLQEHHLLPSNRSARRYLTQLEERGHLRPFKPNGNKPSEVLRGIEYLMLAKYIAAFPKAFKSELRAFLWNCFGRFLPIPRFHTNSELYRAECLLLMSRKKGSTTA